MDIDSFGAYKFCNVCTDCYDNLGKYTTDNLVIPYWIDDGGNIRTDVPMELESLKFAEKQLIALAKSHMNLVHLKNGTLGSTGHVVALEQDISEISTELPRLPSDVKIVKIMRKGMNRKQEVFQ